MFGLSVTELAMIVGVVVLLFGSRKLPELGSGLGKAISNFRHSYKASEAIDITPKEEEKTDDKDKQK